MAMAGRKDWVQADLRCLMCGRIIGATILRERLSGRLLGS